MDETVLRELFATPPPEFVAARNAVVKALRGEKRRDEATAVAALRRPGWDDWALNVVAAEHGDPVAAFADAAAAVRDAQSAAIEGRKGPDVRASLRALRDNSAELIRLAGEQLGRAGREPAGGELNARLSEVAASETAVEALRLGVLGSGGEGSDDLFAGLQPAPRAVKARKDSPAAKQAPAPAPDRSAAPGKVAAAADRAERKRRRDALAAANREQQAAARVLARADTAVAAATEAVERAGRALADAERERAAAAEALARADLAVEAAGR